jgi:hypothetical protein
LRVLSQQVVTERLRYRQVRVFDEIAVRFWITQVAPADSQMAFASETMTMSVRRGGGQITVEIVDEPFKSLDQTKTKI